MSRVAVILPAYNEALTIAATLRDFHAALPDAALYVVDNRSSDDTAALAAATLAELGCAGAVLREPRPGKGNAVRRAFLEVEAEVYVMADADQTYPAAQAHLLLEPVLRGEADMVVGDRHSAGHYAQENKRRLHGFGNQLVRRLVNGLFNARLADIMSGYRAMSRRFVKHYPILVEGFEIETDLTLHALDKRFSILEVPIEYRDRPEGSFSKLNTLSDGLRVLSIIGNILRYYRPLLFFGLMGLLLALLGGLAGWPVIEEWVTQHYVTHVPLAILATGLEVVAIVLLAIGLILDSISHQDKRHFERDLLNYRPPRHESCP